jgi:O-antigen/teichoic acid export membrane protein
LAKVTNSYRQILRSTSIIGGASVINILVGLLRMKVAAILLGPSGVGLIGLFTNLMATASNLAGLGVGSVGTRQIAQAVSGGEPKKIAMVRGALFWLTLSLALIGGMVFWLLRRVLADHVLGDSSMASPLGWLSIAVALSVGAASQNALLNGMRRIADIARISVWSALFSTVGAVAALWWLGPGGIPFYILSAPLASFLLGHWYVARLPNPERLRMSCVDLANEWGGMLKLGFAFMVAGLASTMGQLLVRALVQRQLGAEALGHFQAAWAISMTYIGFVLGAMGTDYYPRLTAVINDHAAVNKLVNEQIEVAMLLAAPVLLGMLALAPWIIRLLYSNQFVDATEILRWQVLGDILKVASWPLGYILVASGAGKAFMCTEWLAMLVFAAVTFWLLPVLGIAATGAAFLIMYVVLFVLVWILAVRRMNFHWAPGVKRLLTSVMVSAVLIRVLAWGSTLGSAVLGSLLAAGWGIYALMRLAHAGGLSGRVGALGGAARSLMLRMGVMRE